MQRMTVIVGMAILAVACAVGVGTSQDAKKDPAKPKATQLPPGWKDLGLTAEQKAEVKKIQQSYKSKIKGLEDQIKEAKAHERQEMVKVLTDDQKDKLRKLAIGEESGKDKKADSEKTKNKDAKSSAVLLKHDPRSKIRGFFAVRSAFFLDH